MPPLEDGGAEMDVVDVERPAVHGDVHALQSSRFARLPREIVLNVIGDRKTAQHGVAELMTAQVPGRRHHPTHAERRAELLGVPAIPRSGTHHFLQGDHVRINRTQHRGDTTGTGPAIEAAASMNVVGRYPERRTRRLSHYVMIVAVMRAWLVVTAFATIGAGCSKSAPDPFQLERNLLTVDNRSSSDWTQVEIWLNTYYRVTTLSIPAYGRFQAPLDTFVAGFGQRFDYHRAQVVDLRLTAKLSDGTPLQLKKQFTARGLAGYLGGKR